MYRADSRTKARKEMAYWPFRRFFTPALLVPPLLFVASVLVYLPWSKLFLHCDRDGTHAATCGVRRTRFFWTTDQSWRLELLRDVVVDGGLYDTSRVGLRLGFKIDSHEPYHVDLVERSDRYLDGPRAYAAQDQFRRFQRDWSTDSFAVDLGPHPSPPTAAIVPVILVAIGLLGLVTMVRDRRAVRLVFDQERDVVVLRSGEIPRAEIEDVVIDATPVAASFTYRLALLRRDGTRVPLGPADAPGPPRRWEVLRDEARAVLEPS